MIRRQGVLLAFVIALWIGTPGFLQAQTSEPAKPTAGQAESATPKVTVEAAPGAGTVTVAAAPKAPETPFDAALGLYRARKFQDAANAFETIAKNDSVDKAGAAKAAAWQSRAFLRMGRVNDAEFAAKRSLTLVDTLPTGHSALGEVYFRQGKMADAEKEFLTPLKAGLPDARAFYGEARLAWYSSNFKHAKQLMEKAHLIDGQDPEITWFWGIMQPRPSRHRGPDLVVTGSDGHVAEKVEASASDIPAERPCKLVTPVKSTESTLERLMLNAKYFRGFGLNVKVNGTNSKLLLDTGASGILLNTKVAEHAGVKPIRDIKVWGIGDQEAANGYVGYAETLQVGGLEFKGCEVRVFDKKRSLGEDGLIGADVFRSFLVDIDFPNEKLKLSELPKPPDATEQEMALFPDEHEAPWLHDRYIAPEMQGYERFYRIGHYLMLPTLVNTTANVRLFLVDTGSYETVLDPDFARTVTKVHNNEYQTIMGISGKVKNVYVADRVTIGWPYSKLMQKTDDLVTFDISDLSDSAGTELSGLVGFSVLWLLDVKIDYRDGLLNFSYDPNRIR